MFMQKFSNNVNSRVLTIALLSLPLSAVQLAHAQPVPQTVDMAKVNVQKLPAGFRASKIIGTTVLKRGLANATAPS
jgi:hypothetical protein